MSIRETCEGMKRNAGKTGSLQQSPELVPEKRARRNNGWRRGKE